MNVPKILALAALGSLIMAASANAQSRRAPSVPVRDKGWEVSGFLLYQDGAKISSAGGSTVDLDEDLGLAFSFGYRFNDRFEIDFGLDWNRNDYRAHVVSASVPGVSFDADGEIESFTPRVNASFNFVRGPFTPYVNAGIGYSFIDTNIPDGPPQNTCWWDPWWGQVCGTFQDTRSFDELVYTAGVGLRWDISQYHSVRFGYERRWLDIDKASSSAEFDQLRLGAIFRY